MLIVTDLLGNSERIVTVRDLQRKRRVNGERELSFSLLHSEIDQVGFDLVQEESEVLFDSDTYIIKQVKEFGSGDRTYKQIDAVHEFFPKMIDQRKYETTSGTKTFAQALSFVFSGSGYTYSIVGSFGSESFENLGDDNRLALFQTVLERYGAEFELSGNVVILRALIGSDTDFQFRYNFNVKTLSRTVDTKNLTTYVKGFGQPLTNSEGTPTGNYAVQGEYYSPNAALYGIREATPVRDDRVTNIATLNKLMEAAVQDTPMLSLELDFLDLRAAGYPYIVPNEGDRVLLIYEPMKLQIVVRLVEVEENFDFYLKPVATKVTLANLNKDITDTVASFSGTQKTVNKVVNKDGTVKTDILGEDVKNATIAVNSALTELQFNNGIRAIDPADPNKRVVITSAGIGITDDAGNTYETAMTGDGINADVISTGQLNTNNVRIAGDTNFFWDGEAIIAQDPTNANKFLKISKSGIQITTNGGATFQTAVDANGVVANSLTSNGSINVQSDAKIGRNLYLGESFTEDSKVIRFNGTAQIGYDASLNKVTMGALGGMQMQGDVEIFGDVYTEMPETGRCGVSGHESSPTTNQIGGTWVAFKKKRYAVPTSITLSTVSSTIGSGVLPQITNITDEGFWMYISGTNFANGYKYWRGTYQVN